jgi:cell division protein FtsW (lipid II flippase)
VSRLLVNNCCMLLACGFIMLTRLSLDKGLDKAFKQFVIVAAAAILSWLVPFIMERFWQLYKFQWVYAGIGLAALLVVWVAGNESFGAQLSLTVGGISIQPSEFVKISFVFFVASMFYQSLDFKNICITTVVAALHVVILVLSKDLGSALIFFISYVIMLFIATGNWLYLIAAGVLGKGATSIAYTLFDHVRRRFTAWKNPWADIDNTGKTPPVPYKIPAASALTFHLLFSDTSPHMPENAVKTWPGSALHTLFSSVPDPGKKRNGNWHRYKWPSAISSDIWILPRSDLS